MKRTPLVVGNWKMELSHKAEIEVLRSLKTILKGFTLKSEVVICPSFPSLGSGAELIKNSGKLVLGAQNIHWEEKGPWTGEVSVLQISPFVRWCIVGHSERRLLTAETDDIVSQKVQTLLKHTIAPIVCVGETAEERESEQTVQKVTHQVTTILSKTTRTSLSKLVIAYEPIWAIGTGMVPESNDVAGIILLIRKLVAERFDAATADKVRLLYGGSITPDTALPFINEPGIDGFLVGEASTHPLQFVEIIKRLDAAAQ